MRTKREKALESYKKSLIQATMLLIVCLVLSIILGLFVTKGAFIFSILVLIFIIIAIKSGVDYIKNSKVSEKDCVDIEENTEEGRKIKYEQDGNIEYAIEDKGTGEKIEIGESFYLIEYKHIVKAIKK